MSTTLMGFPIVTFRLCDFWAIFEETLMDDCTLRVMGALPGGGTVAVALFQPQPGPRGSWAAYSLKEVQL